VLFSAHAQDRREVHDIAVEYGPSGATTTTPHRQQGRRGVEGQSTGDKVDDDSSDALTRHEEFEELRGSPRELVEFGRHRRRGGCCSAVTSRSPCTALASRVIYEQRRHWLPDAEVYVVRLSVCRTSHCGLR